MFRSKVLLYFILSQLFLREIFFSAYFFIHCPSVATTNAIVAVFFIHLGFTPCACVNFLASFFLFTIWRSIFGWLSISSAVFSILFPLFIHDAEEEDDEEE